MTAKVGVHMYTHIYIHTLPTHICMRERAILEVKAYCVNTHDKLASGIYR